MRRRLLGFATTLRLSDIITALVDDVASPRRGGQRAAGRARQLAANGEAVDH